MSRRSSLGFSHGATPSRCSTLRTVLGEHSKSTAIRRRLAPPSRMRRIVSTWWGLNFRGGPRTFPRLSHQDPGIAVERHPAAPLAGMGKSIPSCQGEINRVFQPPPELQMVGISSRGRKQGCFQPGPPDGAGPRVDAPDSATMRQARRSSSVTLAKYTGWVTAFMEPGSGPCGGVNPSPAV